MMDEGLKELGFVLQVSEVAGQPKKFWRLGSYWFSSCGLNAYQIVNDDYEGKVKKFTTRKRKSEKQDEEILGKLREWLKKGGFANDTP